MLRKMKFMCIVKGIRLLEGWRWGNVENKASWLLKELANNTLSRFKELDQHTPLNRRLTALQLALFMIGYGVRTFRG